MTNLFYFIACSISQDSVKDSATQNTPPVWYGDVQPMVAENCSVCHFNEGTAPFSFEQFEDVEPLVTVMLNSMRSGAMPPWLPNPDCVEYQDERILTTRQIDRFERWIDDGLPLGDPALGETPIPLIEDINATHEITMPSGFIPETIGGSDQYRCFELDVQFDTETFITQTQVVPGSQPVHHVLVYALDSDMSEAVREANGADGTVGYPCFGDPFPPQGGGYDNGFPTQIGAWVPGLEPSIFPQGTALRIYPNAVIVMQVHYSALGGTPTEDSTKYRFVVSQETPQQIATTHPLAIQDLDIPAGATNATATSTFTNYYNRPIEISSVATHMHLLGKSQTAKIIREDGTEECLVDIPQWDFSWQQNYKPVEKTTLERGESIELTCSYDNSQANQPIVEGEQITPSDVEWGDGTLDEMCLLYTTTIDPYRAIPPADSEPCYGVDECLDGCGESLSCVMNCESVEFECLTCSLNAFLGCGMSECAVPALLAEPCLRKCYSKSIMMGSPIGACFEYECPDEYAALVECADPVLQSEACSTQLENCGVHLGD